MPKTSQQLIAQVEKLLRLAAPSSGSTEHERAVAGIEAARLFVEHDLTVQAREPVRRAAARQPAPPRRWPPSPMAPPGQNWRRSVAARDSLCDDPDCQGMIFEGDPVWMKMSGFKAKYIHIGGPCGW